MKKNNKQLPFCILSLGLLMQFGTATAQSDQDAIMMNKHQWCNGLLYEHSAWKQYWEGTSKRDNANIGTFTSQSIRLVTNYGISNRLNVLASLPYVANKASGGTLHNMHGLQDASLAVKWKPVAAHFSNSKLSFYAVGSLRVPTHDYVVDFLPLSIGLGATSLTASAIADYQVGKFYTTAYAAYTLRSNITLDRTAYYTDHLINSNRVDMPNVASYLVSTGFRSRYLIAETMLRKVTTLGGFDIRRNDMPFASNRMNMTSLGVHLKYTLPVYTHLEFTADGSRVIKGRNVGQTTTASLGVYYLFMINKKANQPATHS